MSSYLSWLILADDFTGAADTVTAFRRWGHRALLRLGRGATGGGSSDAGVIGYTLELREACEGSPLIREKLNADLKSLPEQSKIYLKIDSTLRGPVETLIQETLQLFEREGWDAASTVVCPAFPAQGRVVRGGKVFVNGRPVERRLHRIGQLHMSDAETDDDLDRLVMERGPRNRLWVGSAGLAAALARAAPGNEPPVALPPVNRAIVVSGSANHVTYAQMDRLKSHSWVGRLYHTERCEAGTLSPLPLENTVNEAMAHTEEAIPTGWVLTGGATAWAFLERTGVTTLEVGGEVSPGIPWMVALDGKLAGSPIISKAGGFGSPDSLLECVRFFATASNSPKSGNSNRACTDLKGDLVLNGKPDG